MTRYLEISMLLLFIFCSLQFALCQDVTVTIAQGQLKGAEKVTDFGLKYYSFIGIPYAKPPVGPLRFKPPQPADSWDGVRDALTLGSSCTQNEDCLYINVVTPKLPSNESLLPTMVYIHGGAFLGGDGAAVPEISDLYLDKDIVVVSMNYRLGPLGFVSTGDSVIPGNYGLKDQVMALKWVQQNIAQFGGDPNRVTIFGMSAGGASVHYQVLSPMTKGLFQGAIAQSGSALNPWAFEDTLFARNRTLRYAAALGANTTDSNAILAYLSTLTFQQLLDGVGKTQTDLERSHAIAFFVPTVERQPGSEEAFLPDHPLNIMAEGKFNHIPFMTGSTSGEGMIKLGEVYNNPLLMDYYYNNFNLILPENVIVYLNESVSHIIADRVKELYFQDKKLTQQTLIQYTSYLGDTQFINGITIHSRLHGAVSTAPVYQYYFIYPGRLGSSLRNSGDLFPGIGHGEEEAYLFYFAPPFDVQGAPENEMSKRMVALWTNFAKTGNPVPQPDPLLQNITWSPVTQLDHFYLEIGNDLIVRRDVINDRIAFWSSIYSNIDINLYHKI